MIYERRITLRAEKVSRREYVYRKPVLSPISYRVPFYMDTPENKALRYAVVCAGGTDNPMPPLPKTTEHIDVLIRQRDWDEQDRALRCWSVQVWLMANQYTQEKRDRMMSSFEFKHLSGLSESEYIRVMTEEHVLSAVGAIEHRN